jgi:hypothetical protein
MSESNKTIEQNESRNKADSQGQKAPIWLPRRIKENSDWCCNKTAKAENFGNKPMADPMMANIPTFCNFLSFADIKYL